MDPVMGVVGAVVIARWSWSLMRDTAAVLIDQTDDYRSVARELLEASGDARITDLHVSRIGPGARAAIVEIETGATAQSVGERLRPFMIQHLTISIAPPT
jgi:Co/Zn/Cd efflux system component